jgi:hypothetical protein
MSDEHFTVDGTLIQAWAHGRGNQSVAVLHQRMAQVAQLRFLAIALLVQPRIGIRRGLVRLLAMEVVPVSAFRSTDSLPGRAP